MVEARVVAEAMPKGADRCVVEGIIANRDNRLDEAASLLPPCLAILERTRSPRAQEAFETLLDTYPRRGEYEREYRLIVRWLAAHDDRTGPDKLADLRNELGTAAVLRDLSRPRVTGSRRATLRSYLNVLGTRNVDLTVPAKRNRLVGRQGRALSDLGIRSTRLRSNAWIPSCSSLEYAGSAPAPSTCGGRRLRSVGKAQAYRGLTG